MLHPIAPAGPIPQIPQFTKKTSRTSQQRTEFRDLLNEQLQHLTGDESVTMKYKRHSYLEEIVLAHHLQLVGWPKGILFANVSDLTGGMAVLACLIRELESGRLHFRRVSPKYAARLWVRGITPSRCPPDALWLGRSDVKKHRKRTVKFARFVLTGPKTPALVSDSPAYDESDGDENDLGDDDDETEDDISESDEGDDAEAEDRVSEWSDVEK